MKIGGDIVTTLRTHYKDAFGRLHFCVWDQDKSGQVYNVEDYIILKLK